MSGVIPWLIYMNESAGSGVKDKVLDQVVDALRDHAAPFEIIRCGSGKGDEEARTLQAFEQQRPGIIVIGGDGTIHQIVNRIGLNRLRSPLAIIPVGTGNDFARQCGLLGRNIRELVVRFLASEPSEVDLLVVNGVLGLQVLSSGLDALVSRTARTLPGFIGRTRYVLAFLKVIVSKSGGRGFKFHMVCDGLELASEAMFIAIANGRYYGGGMLISPDSNNADGILEIVIIKRMPRFRTVLLFPLIFTGGHIRHQAVEVFRARQIQLTADALSEMDGESLPFDPGPMTIATKRLRVWTI